MSSKVWLITGASSGIGLAIAKYVLSQGDKVIVTVRSLSKLPEELKGTEALALDLNASDDEIRKVGEAALKIYGHIDVLINNAGYGLAGPVEELKMEDIRTQFQTNVFSVIALTQVLLPHFRARKSGHIINISTVSAYWNYPSWGAYSASKAAIDAFSETLSYELEPYGIRVLVFFPGYFPTKFFSQPRAAEVDSTVYTDPMQGYQSRSAIPKGRYEGGQIGDVDKFAQRTYEIVHGTGLAEGLVEGQGGKRSWMRVPLGSDCSELMLQKMDSVKENIVAVERITRSTDVEADRLKEFAV
ncbi:NAD-P-binding protein [Sparassis latifolia]|uniref:NADP-dependent 3-hydroxy acid dehydrogenase n=1 Tax=Sparassis crispa TaxID=139825 RepID=A0A401GPU9_9APHY|nr:NADP-dependent 3-hydroxy acid dehydrogenase [Sparassis crispa]GBE84247.1 NADP-dependent 3-hydroxy acid dehydrogenase [Sparassis crispa]